MNQAVKSVAVQQREIEVQIQLRITQAQAISNLLEIAGDPGSSHEPRDTTIFCAAHVIQDLLEDAARAFDKYELIIHEQQRSATA